MVTIRECTVLVYYVTSYPGQLSVTGNEYRPRASGSALQLGR